MTSGAPRRGRPRGSAGPREVAATARAVATRLFAQQGFAATHMRDIARESGVTPGALYHHYPSKEALLVEVIEEVLEREGRALRALIGNDEPVHVTLLRLLEDARHSSENHAVLRGTLVHLPEAQQQRVAEFFTAQLAAQLEGVLRRGVERGELRPHDLALSTWTLMSVLAGLPEVPPGAVNNLPQATLDLLMQGLQPETPP